MLESMQMLLLLLLSHFSRVQFCATPWTAAHQAPQSLGFSRQEYWSGLPFNSPVHKSESDVSQSCPTLSEPMDCSLPGSSVHGIFQARVLDWGSIAFSTMQVGHSKSFLRVRLLQVLCKVIESVTDFAEESQRTEYSLSPQGFSSVVTNQSPK